MTDQESVGGQTGSGAYGASASSAAQHASRQEYKLGSGDQLRVIVFGDEDLSGECVVDGSGRVQMPLAGEIQARGMSLREF